jgi:hypothetical protein
MLPPAGPSWTLHNIVPFTLPNTLILEPIAKLSLAAMLTELTSADRVTGGTVTAIEADLLSL